MATGTVKAKPTPDELWRITLTEGHRGLITLHWLFRHLPSSPRCKMCFSPFAGVGGLTAEEAGTQSIPQFEPAFFLQALELDPGEAHLELRRLRAVARGHHAPVGPEQ